MNARDKYRIARIAQAGLGKDFERKRNGELTKRAAKRVENLWNEWGGIIADPSARPYHVYRPRKAANLKRAAAYFGVDLRSKIKAIPIPIPSGRKAAVRITDSGDLKLSYSGGIIKLVEWVPISHVRSRVRSLISRGLEVEATLQTGKGTWNPADHGLTVTEGIKYLRGKYKNSDRWLFGAQLTVVTGGRAVPEADYDNDDFEG